MKGGETLIHNESKFIYPTTNRHSARNYFVSANYALVNILGKLFYSDKPNVKKVAEAKITTFEKPQNRTIVLIIGESLRADRFFDKKLTPKTSPLIKSNNTYAKKIYSGGTMTKVSVATLINIVPGPGYFEHIVDESSCLFKLAQNNGFKTTFISNQPARKLDIIQNLICPKYINNYLDKERLQGSTGHDEDILEHIKQKGISSGNNFIVLQFRGSHSPYEKRYPAKNKDKNLSNYDNSVKYTDTVLHDLLNYFKQQEQKVSLYFTPDHGELLGENGKNGHGFMEPSVYNVPVILWSNYDENLKENLNAINSHFQLSKYIAKQLGYQVEHELSNIKILNSDLDGFSGHAEVINNEVIFKKQ